MRKIVAMPLIPGRIVRETRVRTDLSYARYATATWRWWCRQRGIEFVLLDRPLGGQAFVGTPPTVQRWLALELLLNEHGGDARIALVDADTMVRWDAPDFLDGEGLCAVRALGTPWIHRSIKAYQALFPGVELPWWEYFNAGVVVMSRGQVPTIRAFLEFYRRSADELGEIQRRGEVGTDQTPLNFVVRREREPVRFLPPPFNTLHCFSTSAALRHMAEHDPRPDWRRFEELAFGRPEVFDFIEYGYVWHFCSILAARPVVMRETWRRIRAHYPGASPGESQAA
jgi:hypothetical protein